MTGHLLTIREAAGRLGISADYLYRLARDGEIDHYRIGKRVLFAPAHLDAYLESCLVRIGERRGRPAAVLKHVRISK